MSMFGKLFWKDEGGSKDASKLGKLENQVSEGQAVIIQDTEVVPVEIRKKVEKALSNTDTVAVGHLLRELCKAYSIKWAVTADETSTKISINWKLKKEKSQEKVYLEMLKKHEEAKVNNQSWKDKDIVFGNFSISLEESYSGQINFIIKGNNPLTQDDFLKIREIFEKFVYESGDWESVPRIDEEYVTEHLGLSDSDIVVLDEKKLEIKIFTEENAQVKLPDLLKALNGLSNKSTYSERRYANAKENPVYPFEEKQSFIIESYGETIHSPIEFELQIGKKYVSLTVKLPNNGFNRKFFVGFFAPFIKETIQLATSKNQESITDYLVRMGVQVYEKKDGDTDLQNLYEREGFVGYEDVKEHIENGVIHAWKNKDEFERIAKEKYANIKDIVPNAVLFEWPAGTGKTTLARIIGTHLSYPFVYIPLNSFMSKWYGEATIQLWNILEGIGKLAQQSGWAVIMIDEIDEIWGDREKSHEATGKITGVLLKKLDGMERIANILLVGATNRKDILDPALLSRFKYSQHFRYPNEKELSAIAKHYMPQLGEASEQTFAPYVGKLSWRSIKNVCEDVARIAIQNEIGGKETNILETFERSLKRASSNNEAE